MSKTPTAEVLLKKISSASQLTTAIKHNRRQNHYQAHLRAAGKNETLHGPNSVEAVTEVRSERLRAAGIVRCRKNQVHAVEVVITLPSGALSDDRPFFVSALHWLATHFSGGLDNVLSADIHRDESAPHMHILILPLVGGALRGSDMVGSFGKLKAVRDTFDRQVCAKYALRLSAGRLTGPETYRAASMVRSVLAEKRDPVLKSVIWTALSHQISLDPRAYLEPLGIDPRQFRRPKRLRTMAEIMTSPGKGPKRRPKDHAGSGATLG